MTQETYLAPERPRIYRGWWIVLISVVGLSFSTGTTLIYTFGVFAKPLANELRTNRSSLALALSMLDLVVTFAAPGAGRFIDCHGARQVIVCSLVALSLCLVGLSCVQPPLWHLYALYALAGLTGIATLSISYSRVVANWFDRQRGLALGVANSGSGVGAFITPLFAQFLIDRAGWRIAFVGLAGACLAVAPLVWFFLRTRPQEADLFPYGVTQSAMRAPQGEPLDGMTAREALRTRTFWQLAFIFFCVAASVNGASAHLVPLLTDAGVSGRWAALAASVFGAAMIAGRVGNGYFVDYFSGLRVAAFVFTGAALGVAILWSGPAVGTAFLAAALLGVAAGAEGDLMPFLVSRYFGMRSMGELYGCIFGVFTIGNAAGRYLLAAGFDAWGSYKLSLAFATLALAVSAGGSLALGDYSKQQPK